MSTKKSKEPRIVSSPNLKSRSYVVFYYKGQRERLYNGKKLGKAIYPNLAHTIEDRDRLLYLLLEAVEDALSNDTFGTEYTPDLEPKPAVTVHDRPEVLGNALDAAIKVKRKADISIDYKKQLEKCYEELKMFFTAKELGTHVRNIPAKRFNEYLEQFDSSGTYYMSKRATLSALIGAAAKVLEFPINTVKATEVRRKKPQLHIPYSDNQIPLVLKYLKYRDPKLFLCCLITYACWLRPHVEIRNLRVAHFRRDFTQIALHAGENKSRRIRIYYVPEFVRQEVLLFVNSLRPTDNIFSGKPEALNEDYFKTKWGRIKSKMLKDGIITPKQTIYSFRHTAAVKLYENTLDVLRVQRALGHKSVTTTENYLRSLGVQDVREAMENSPTGLIL